MGNGGGGGGGRPFGVRTKGDGTPGTAKVEESGDPKLVFCAGCGPCLLRIEPGLRRGSGTSPNSSSSSSTLGGGGGGGGGTCAR